MTPRVLLFGTMGDIGPVVRNHFTAYGVSATLVDFPQTVFKDEPGYRRELLKALSGACLHEGQSAVGEGFTHVIPIGCPVAMSRLSGEIGERFPHCRIMVETPDKVELLDSKLRSYELFKSLGINVPRVFASVDEVPTCQMAEGGPKCVAVFKRDVSFAGQGVRMPHSLESLRHMVHAQGHPGTFMIQEYVAGAEYSVDVVRVSRPGGGDAASGSICRTSAYRHDGATRTICHMPDLERTAVRVLEHLDYSGVCGFDFIVDDRGVAYLLEANPRLTGGIATQLAAGFDIPMMLLSMDL